MWGIRKYRGSSEVGASLVECVLIVLTIVLIALVAIPDVRDEIPVVFCKVANYLSNGQFEGGAWCCKANDAVCLAKFKEEEDEGCPPYIAFACE